MRVAVLLACGLLAAALLIASSDAAAARKLRELHD